MIHERNTSRWLWRGLVVWVVLAVVTLRFGVPWLFWHSVGVDYGTRTPPPRVFQMVFRQPVPRGVSNIRVAGHGFLQGHDVWMRFHATDEVIEALTSKYCDPIDQPEFLRWCPQALFSEDDPSAIAWADIFHLRKPEFYHFDGSSNGQGWYGSLAVDRSSHQVFVYAGIL